MGPALLEARDARQELLRGVLEEAGRDGSVLFLSTNVPGPDKHRPGLARLVQGALADLEASIGLEVRVSGRDLLGPFHLAWAPVPPGQAKGAALAVESGAPCGRLLDLDVYEAGGAQLDRSRLGLAQRPCLLCAEPARECIRLGRHGGTELLERVDALLRPLLTPLPVLDPDRLAAALHRGALEELDLTPKPGLVDRRDCGSHPDLSHAAMRASADLLPHYYEDLLRCSREGRPLAHFVRAGQEAELRMVRAIGSNAHKGYHFLSGLLLMAAHACGGRPDPVPGAIAATAAQFFAQQAPLTTHGASVRAAHGLGGIRAEAERGLPAVFRHGWPRYREALEAGWDLEQARFLLMAVLMQQVEDTTAVSRCGLPGLARLRRDGAALQRRLEQGFEPGPWLAELNEDYCAQGLTMGGVADCLALTLALQEL